MELADFELGLCLCAERFVSDQDLETAITKVLETFDGVENLSAEQRDGIANFIRSNDVLAVLPTGFGKSRFVTFVHLPFSVRSVDLFADSLMFMKGTSCCVTQRNFKQSRAV